MIAPLAKLIDWSVLQVRVTLNLLKSGKPHTNGRSLRLEEALKQSDFFAVARRYFDRFGEIFCNRID